MAIDFPNSPSTGDFYTVDDRTWRWDGYKWAIYATNLSQSNYNAKGDLLVGTGNDTVGTLSAGTTGQYLTANSGASVGLEWATLDLSSYATKTGSETLTNKTITGAILDQSAENWNVVASAATGTINLDVLTASIWYYTSNATANHTVNVRGDGSTTLSSLLGVGDSITVMWANTNGATAYYPSTFQVDGSTITPKWQGDAAPTEGNASSIDFYTYVILKTAATPTYTVFAAQTQFK